MPAPNNSSGGSDVGSSLMAIFISLFIAWALLSRPVPTCQAQTKAIAVTQLVPEHEVNATVLDTFTYYVGTADAMYETQLDIYARLEEGHTYTVTISCDNRIVNIVKVP